MLDPQSVFITAIGCLNFLLAGFFLRFVESLQRRLDSLVADGMETDLKSGAHTLLRHLVQLRLLVLRQTGIVGIVGIRLEKGGGF